MNPLSVLNQQFAIDAETMKPVQQASPAELTRFYEDGLHPDDRATAQARADLVRAWHLFRQEAKNLIDANQEFEHLYNTGAYLPNVFGKLGKVSVQTLYKWAQKDPESTYDYMFYIPGYRRNGHGETRISLTRADRETFEKFIFNQNRFKISEAIFYAKAALKAAGTPSAAGDHTFRRYAEWLRQTHTDAWTFLREGKKALTDDVIFSIVRDRTKLEVGQVLVADGHRLNFQIINPLKGRPCRAAMIGFLDWRSGDLCGFEIMPEENTQTIASALRSAIIYLGRFPKYVYQDNGKAFKARYFQNSPDFNESGFYGLYSKFQMTPVFSAPYNARAKIIERWWKEFNSFERLQLSYTGAGIEDKPAWMMRNEKWHKILRGQHVPDIYEACEMINWWLDLRRNTKKAPQDPECRTIRQMMEAHRGKGIDIDSLDELMMETKVTKIYSQGIRHNKEWYWAEELYGIELKEAVVKYSIFDRDFIKVYSRAGQKICTARRWDKQHPLVHYEGTEAEKERFKDVISLQSALRKKTVIKAQQLIGGKPLMAKAAEERKRTEPEVIELEERIPEEAVRQGLEAGGLQKVELLQKLNFRGLGA